MKKIYKEDGVGAGVSAIGALPSGPTNVVGSGQIAGVGVGPQGEPGGPKVKMGSMVRRKYSDFSENSVLNIVKSVVSEAIENREVAAELFMRCRNASTMAHVAHLMTNSYAEHVALNDFYSGIVDLADSFAEAYNGKYGKIPSYPTLVTDGKTGLDVVKGLRDWIDNNRSRCCSESSIQNIIDEIVDLCNSTIYKLENLK